VELKKHLGINVKVERTENKSTVQKKEVQIQCMARSFGINDSLLTLVQHKGSGMVLSRHSDNSVAVIGHRAALVHSVASDG